MKINKPITTDTLGKVAGKQKPKVKGAGDRSFQTDLQKASGSKGAQAPAAKVPLNAAALNKASAVSVSLANQGIEAATKLVAQTPEVRAKLIAELKAKIEKGEYKIDPKKVADKMIKNGFVDILIRPI